MSSEAVRAYVKGYAGRVASHGRGPVVAVMFAGDEVLGRPDQYLEEYDDPDRADELDERCAACDAEAGQPCRPHCPARSGGW
jgi:hypothetical protein